MGQEIDSATFAAAEFSEFARRLQHETALLRGWLKDGRFDAGGPHAGCELEAWLVDPNMNAAPANRDFLDRFASSSASAELAKFNVEFNTTPLPLQHAVFSALEYQLTRLLDHAREAALAIGLDVLLTGILPTLRDEQLAIGNLSDSNRYRALNEQVLSARHGQPVRLAIEGREPLLSVHDDVMLEAATTSFQLHWQLAPAVAAEHYNALLVASGPVLAASTNSPFLFGRDVWAETRIPLFEQAVPIGGYGGAECGPLHRVGFGTGWVRQSLAEVFEENLLHFPVLLPTLFAVAPEHFAHLRLHNGTIWRWNRPVIGFSLAGVPHLRIEHRVLPAGPSVADMVANAAFLFGLVEHLAVDSRQAGLSFAEARDNFYRAARHGLDVRLLWGGEHVPACTLIRRQLLPMARKGLLRLQVDLPDIDRCLGVIEQRVATRQTGSAWQRAFLQRHSGDFSAMTGYYLEHQLTGQPVHTWPL